MNLLRSMMREAKKQWVLLDGLPSIEEFRIGGLSPGRNVDTLAIQLLSCYTSRVAVRIISGLCSKTVVCSRPSTRKTKLKEIVK